MNSNFEFRGERIVRRVVDSERLDQPVAVFYADFPQQLNKVVNWWIATAYQEGFDARGSEDATKFFELWNRTPTGLFFLDESDAHHLEHANHGRYVRVDLHHKRIEIRDPERSGTIVTDIIVPRIQFY